MILYESDGYKNDENNDDNGNEKLRWPYNDREYNDNDDEYGDIVDNNDDIVSPRSVRTAAGQHRRACDTSRDLGRGTRMPRRSSIVWPRGPDTRFSLFLSLSSARTRYCHTKAGERAVRAGPAGCACSVCLSLAPDMSRSRSLRTRQRAWLVAERASRTVIIHSREPNIQRHTFANLIPDALSEWCSNFIGRQWCVFIPIFL